GDSSQEFIWQTVSRCSLPDPRILTPDPCSMISPANIDRSLIEHVVRQVVLAQMDGSASTKSNGSAERKLVVSISARHCHLTDEHVEILFGKGRTLTPAKDLYQDGFYAAEETVMIVGPNKRRMLPSVRVLGPTRPASQV